MRSRARRDVAAPRQVVSLVALPSAVPRLPLRTFPATARRLHHNLVRPPFLRPSRNQFLFPHARLALSYPHPFNYLRQAPSTPLPAPIQLVPPRPYLATGAFSDKRPSANWGFVGSLVQNRYARGLRAADCSVFGQVVFCQLGFWTAVSEAAAFTDGRVEKSVRLGAGMGKRASWGSWDWAVVVGVLRERGFRCGNLAAGAHTSLRPGVPYALRSISAGCIVIERPSLADWRGSAYPSTARATVNAD